MTKHDPAVVSKAKGDAMETLEHAAKPVPEAAVPAKPDAEKHHGPTTTMKSGWASGGSAAG